MVRRTDHKNDGFGNHTFDPADSLPADANSAKPADPRRDFIPRKTGGSRLPAAESTCLAAGWRPKPDEPFLPPPSGADTCCRRRPGALRPRLFSCAPSGGCCRLARPPAPPGRVAELLTAGRPGGLLQAAERPTENSRGRQPTGNDHPGTQALEGRQRFWQHTLPAVDSTF